MKKNPTMFRILISYLLVTLIPVLVLGIMISGLINNTLKKELITNQQGMQQRLRMTFDSIIDEMDTNAIQMLNSSIFSSYHLNSSYGNFLDVSQQLSSVVYTNDYLAEVCYANSVLDTIISPKTMYTTDTFNRFGPSYSTMMYQPEAIMSKLIPNKKRDWLPFQSSGTQDTREIFTYIVTNKVSDFPPTASILFQLDRQRLDTLTRSTLSNTQASFIVEDLNHNILYSFPHPLRDEILHAVEDLPQSDQPTEIKTSDNTYLVFRTKSNNSAIAYTSVIPYGSVLAPIVNYQLSALVFMCIVSLLCLAIIAYSMRVNFAPFKAIFRLITVLGGGDENQLANADEFEAARTALLHYNEMEQLRAKEKITLKLLQGAYSSFEAFVQEGLAVDYVLNGPLFRVISVYINAQSSELPPDQFSEIASFMENNLMVYTSVSTLCYPEINTIYFIASGEEESLNSLNLRLKQLQMLISNTYCAVMSIGVGNIVTIEQTSLSASQSSIACEYRFTRGNDAITFYSEFKNTKPISSYPYHEIDALYHAILHGDKERIQFVMNTLIQYITETDSLLYGTCLAYDILNTAIKASQHLNLSVLTVSLTQQKDTPRSVDEIIAIVNFITGQIVSFIGQPISSPVESPATVSTLEQILHFITTHYCDSSFSVKTLADHFQMSTSNLSHYFKKQTGQTVSEYIALLRLDKAKEMLRTSDTSLQNIAPLCGYLHLSTLIRQFKLREGCTPTNYRARFRG